MRVVLRFVLLVALLLAIPAFAQSGKKPQKPLRDQTAETLVEFWKHEWQYCNLSKDKSADPKTIKHYGMKNLKKSCVELDKLARELAAKNWCQGKAGDSWSLQLRWHECEEDSNRLTGFTYPPVVVAPANPEADTACIIKAASNLPKIPGLAIKGSSVSKRKFQRTPQGFPAWIMVVKLEVKAVERDFAYVGACMHIPGHKTEIFQ